MADRLPIPAALAAHLADRVRAARHRYHKRLARSQKKFSAKAVHELRVETRRLLALLDLLGALPSPKPLKKLRKVFKQRLDAFDDLRDTQVQRCLLRPLWRDFPRARELKRQLRHSERRLVTKLDGNIQAAKYARLNRQLKRIEKQLRPRHAPPASAADTAAARAALDRAFRRAMIMRRKVRRSDTATIHCLRVAFKHFRYLAELLQPFLPEVTAERLKAMRDYQATAGAVQDREVLLARLTRWVADGDVDGAAIADLRRELLRRRHEAIDSFMRRIDDLAKFGRALRFDEASTKLELT